MAQPRLGTRRGPQKQSRWSVYIPLAMLPEWNEMSSYARKKKISMSFLIRSLLLAWYASEKGGTNANETD